MLSLFVLALALVPFVLVVVFAFLFAFSFLIVVRVVRCSCVGRGWGGRWKCLILLYLWAWCWAIKHVVLLNVRARSPRVVVLAIVPGVVLPCVAFLALVFAFAVSLLAFEFLCERLREDVG